MESQKQILDRERREVLQQIEDWLDIPMIVLAWVWLVLFVVELTVGLNPLLQTLGTVIWIIFIFDFALTFTIAPRKIAYLKNNWLTAIAFIGFCSGALAANLIHLINHSSGVFPSFTFVKYSLNSLL
jgi:hypothetical protein